MFQLKMERTRVEYPIDTEDCICAKYWYFGGTSKRRFKVVIAGDVLNAKSNPF